MAKASVAKVGGRVVSNQIFVHHHLSSNQVLYTLKEELLTHERNLKQFPFLGKKSAPAVIRPDSWLPMARITFSSTHEGMIAYRLLREFRMRHELEYDHSAIDKLWDSRRGDPTWENRSRLPFKRRKKMFIKDQKANSIADMAMVLQILRGEVKQDGTRHVKHKVTGTDEVEVNWTNIEDASYAAEWPTAAKHGYLSKINLAPKVRNVRRVQRVATKKPSARSNLDGNTSDKASASGEHFAEDGEYEDQVSAVETEDGRYEGEVRTVEAQGEPQQGEVGNGQILR